MSKSFDEEVAIFDKLFSNKMSEDEAKELLVTLYKKGESASQIAAAASVMREHSIKLDISSDLSSKLIDNCGTGGDKSGSFNISTTVSLLLASCGCYVAKHGNRSITSKSGSADMLEVLGIRLDLDPKDSVKMLEEVGFAFLFAVNHHPAMKYIMPIRRSLDHRTIFNILGPLTNPAGVKKQLIGVFSDDYIARISEALKILDTKEAMVVSSRDGMDEISICDVTYASHLKDDKISELIIDPTKFGLKMAKSEDILGGDAKLNATITKDILEGRSSGAKRDVVLLNAAAALMVDGKARDIQDGIEIARDSIDSGSAKESLAKIIRVSSKF
jgi:anthranilate phosphoribosyltransferase